MTTNSFPIELWGGVECTVNRVGDHYRDQVRLSGHHDRLSDLDLFADLGLKAIRYPVLWERTVPELGKDPDWRWPDERLNRLRALGIRPIVGLVHHGSGPRHTNLVDDRFAAELGHYAAAVAERYPWVEDFTPVNEPLTTARFSALYGHWYPHATDPRSFWLSLLNQVDGTRAAMRAVRRVNPAARLIQTDDLGRTYATAPLGEQAAYDNLRRWAGWDLLFGRIDRSHPLFAIIERVGLGERLIQIADDPCPPDVIGINHYLTSDRFLDHRVDRYPAHLHGGNGKIAYADTEAIRVLDPPPSGLGGALREAWQRYRTPIAVTEVHNGSTREEQLRWAAEAWDISVSVAAECVDIRAVTAWSLLGSQGWNTLVTRDGKYESGVYDVADGTPRPTALASLWRNLPLGALRPPVSMENGWWRRPERLIYGTARTAASNEAPSQPRSSHLLLIWKGKGIATQACIRACMARGISHALVEASPSTINGIDSVLDELSAWGLLYIRADDVLNEKNLLMTFELAKACLARGMAFLDVLNASDENTARNMSKNRFRSDPFNSEESGTPAPDAGAVLWQQMADDAIDRLIDNAAGA
ncbi:family 1 glycosylhydrolase [Sphingomonas sp. XXL09]|uniref:family 1 glycosylhydrolase n=1 Tax=Sphingomonas sp. XXL09 TaxID=3457787 RepID=UPI00406BD75F